MNFNRLFFVFIASMVLLSCEINKVEELLSLNQAQTQTQAQNLNIPTYSSTELIIRFKSSITDAQKIDLRRKYKVVSYEYCDLCPDQLIENWSFDEDVSVEDKKISIQSGSGGPEGDITNVDHQFTFHLEDENNTALSTDGFYDYSSKIVASNLGVTLAVLDTGVDANYPLFGAPFLYNSSGDSVLGEPSGWDFVNHDSDFSDDYNLIHGTKVSYIINHKLKEENIPHQILPVKVCDANGVATYFNIICGFKYALSRANIIQMSLGWYDENVYVNTIFNDLINENSNVLIVTSAGNSGVDNDLVSHYPSSYPQKNILAIAASNTNNTDIASFSNYGINNVDFYAPGENVQFYDITGASVQISGTSYAAPFVASKAAKILYDSGMLLTPDDIIDNLNSAGIPTTYSKPVKYLKLLN